MTNTSAIIPKVTPVVALISGITIQDSICLIDPPKERNKLRKELIAKNGVQILFTGRPEIYGDRLIELVLNRIK